MYTYLYLYILQGPIQDINRIIMAVSKAAYPVCNAFFILLIIAAIFATLGTHLFRSRSIKYFGSFSTSLFTMFQVLTGDSWASDVAREVFKDSEGDQTDHSVGINM
jgi:voltage-gated sodium channel